MLILILAEEADIPRESLDPRPMLLRNVRLGFKAQNRPPRLVEARQGREVPKGA